MKPKVTEERGIQLQFIWERIIIIKQNIAHLGQTHRLSFHTSTSCPVLRTFFNPCTYKISLGKQPNFVKGRTLD